MNDKITEYLSNGGYFNPEFMEHDKVKDLLMDIREQLAVYAKAIMDKDNRLAELDRKLYLAEARIKQLKEMIINEREACATVCDGNVDAEYATGKVDHNEMSWSQACAIAIRARGEK